MSLITVVCCGVPVENRIITSHLTAQADFTPHALGLLSQLRAFTETNVRQYLLTLGDKPGSLLDAHRYDPSFGSNARISCEPGCIPLEKRPSHIQLRRIVGC